MIAMLFQLLWYVVPHACMRGLRAISNSSSTTHSLLGLRQQSLTVYNAVCVTTKMFLSSPLEQPHDQVWHCSSTP